MGKEKIKYTDPMEIEFYDWCENSLKKTSDIQMTLIQDWLKNSEYKNTIGNGIKLMKVYMDFLKYNFKNIEMG